MKKFIAILFAFIYAASPLQAQDVTGLEGFSLFLDPGHSRTENQGLYNYSEAQKVLRVGLALREMLLSQTDIDTVYMSRTNDSQLVSLSQRTDLANSLAPDFFHSIHSNAGSSTTNNTLFLYGGWRSNGQTVEKTPKGGKAMGDIMEDIHTNSMRIPTIGNWADRNFYQGANVNHHTNQWPYLFVNRTTDMASVVSESGFHTNPDQQMRNLNAEWKRLEAQSFFWVTLEYLGVERPQKGIAAGFITNFDNNAPLNGATVSIGDSSYTTDTFESLFNQYTSDPEDLKNGFYYLENLPIDSAQLIVQAEGFYSDTVGIKIDSTEFTFTDVSLISSVAPFVVETTIGEDGSINPGEDLVITFSRAMNTASVDSAINLLPTADWFRSWNSAGNELTITTGDFDFESSYILTIDSMAIDSSPFAHKLDGDNDGEQGGTFVLEFDTGQEDIIAPTVSYIYPTNTRFSELNPIVSATFSEQLDTTSIESMIELRKGTYVVPGTVKYYVVGDKSVLNFFPSERLDKNSNYKIELSGAISDTVGNAIGSDVIRTFPTGDQEFNNITSVDHFDAGVGSWWQPSQSGSTTGYTPNETSMEASTEIVNVLTESTGALKLNYGFDTDVTSHLIREYRHVGLPRFSNTKILQSYVFGDGSGNKIRFMVRDSNSQLEGSEWYTVDWLGWKLLSWDMAQDSVFGWANGNGVINGNVYVDSYQVTYTPGSPEFGFLIFDDLRAVNQGLATSNEQVGSEIPTQLSLDQNYPNPFNPSTNINFGLPDAGIVSLKVYDMLGREVATLVDGHQSEGFHSISFDASSLSSGVYLYRLTTPNSAVVKKMTLIK
ncbi:MAG: N-acetylmuramoyl-L-alanine amidase [Balneolaceae bacterium]|nr:N-acetylmuramoyl-L-alanine amidase [Balneolaceae bacterium]